MELQRRQLFHDENYHKEISRLPVKERLQHMALHISKYFSKFVEEFLGERACSTEWVDAFIICVSTINTLNRKLAEVWELSHIDVASDRLWGDLEKNYEIPDEHTLLVELAKCNQVFSAACEKIDHLEAYDFRVEIINSVSKFAALVALKLNKEGDVFERVDQRLSQVKSKSIFHN